MTGERDAELNGDSDGSRAAARRLRSAGRYLGVGGVGGGNGGPCGLVLGALFAIVNVAWLICALLIYVATGLFETDCAGTAPPCP